MTNSSNQPYDERQKIDRGYCVLPSSNLMLADLGLEEGVSDFVSFSRRLSPFHRTHYRAVVNWLIKCRNQSSTSKLEQIKPLLEVFYHLCEAEDLERATKVFFMRINPPVNQELQNQLYIWGKYTELLELSERFLNFLNSESQSIRQTELKQIITLKIICLNNLGIVAFARGDCISSIDYHTQQLAVSRAFKDFFGEASSLIGLGRNSKLLGKYQEATGYYLTALNVAMKILDRKLTIASFSGLGSIQVHSGQYEQAIEYFQQQLKIANETFDNSGKAQALTDLGNVYSLVGKYEEAVDSHLNALKITHFIDNPENESKILAHLGFAFYTQKEYRAAISFYKYSLTISRINGLFLEEAEALANVGILESKLAQSKQEIEELSLDKLREALARFRKIGNSLGKARTLKELAEIYEKWGEIELALQTCKEALDIANSLNLPIKNDCTELIAKIHAKKLIKKVPDTRKFQEIDLEKCAWLGDGIDIVLLTANPIELNAVLDKLKSYPSKKTRFKVFEGAETYYLGKFGAFKAVVTKCRMGAISEGSVILATDQAQRLWKPRAIIMVGVAFGKDKTQQKIGDVLVASQIISYESQRVGQPAQYRGSIPPSNTTLLNRFENVHDWEFLDPNGSPCRLQTGAILSGEKLIDDPEFKSALFQQFPQAIGGEMEGSGLCAASGRVGIPWILVKSICDWADGTKNNEYQDIASASAVSLVHHVLSQKTVLNSFSPNKVSEFGAQIV